MPPSLMSLGQRGLYRVPVVPSLPHADSVFPRTSQNPILRFMVLMTSTDDRNATMEWSVMGMYLKRGSAP